MDRLYDLSKRLLVCSVMVVIALELVRPYLGQLAAVAISVCVARAWRAWRRSRW